MDMLASLLAMAERLEAYGRAGIKIREAYEEIRRAEGGGEPPKNPLEFDLTPKEQEIYQLLGEGMEPREIAAKLGKSLKTIEAQRDTMRKKLGFATSHELTQAARRAR